MLAGIDAFVISVNTSRFHYVALWCMRYATLRAEPPYSQGSVTAYSRRPYTVLRYERSVARLKNMIPDKSGIPCALRLKSREIRDIAYPYRNAPTNKRLSVFLPRRFLPPLSACVLNCCYQPGRVCQLDASVRQVSILHRVVCCLALQK